jgi:hypothetical protein
MLRSPHQAPLLRRLLDISQASLTHPAQATLLRGRGPLPHHVSPPVFRSTSTVILNVLYLLGPEYVAKGRKGRGNQTLRLLGAGGSCRMTSAWKWAEGDAR